MAKQIKDLSHIDLEIKHFQEKLNQFQTYMELNNIITQVTKGDEIMLTEENQDKLHKEILIQIKMQDAILSWLPLLKKLREEDATKKEQVRGGAEIGGMFTK